MRYSQLRSYGRRSSLFSLYLSRLLTSIYKKLCSVHSACYPCIVGWPRSLNCACNTRQMGLPSICSPIRHVSLHSQGATPQLTKLIQYSPLISQCRNNNILCVLDLKIPNFCAVSLKNFKICHWVIICEISQGLEVTISGLNKTLHKCRAHLETDLEKKKFSVTPL